MYKTADGDELFIIDGPMAFWDGRPANQTNRHGVESPALNDYLRNLSPKECGWRNHKLAKYDEETFYQEPFGRVVKNPFLIDKDPGSVVNNEYFARCAEDNPCHVTIMVWEWPLIDAPTVPAMLDEGQIMRCTRPMSVMRDQHDCKGRSIHA